MTTSGAYVGRVGGLAVALGIGAAIATGQGVAWADSSGSSSEPPGSSASPEHSPSSSGAAAGAPAAASAGTAVERKRLSVPSVRPWGGQGHRKAVVGRDGSRLTRKSSTDDDTTPEERPASAPERTEEPLDTTAATPGPETGTPASGESTASHQAADEPAVTPAVDEEPTVAGDPAVTPEGPSETSDGAADISDATVLRSTLSSRQSTANTLERWRSRHELAPVTRTGGQAVDIGTAAEAPIDAVASDAAQIPAAAMPFAAPLSTTVVDSEPVIARAAPAAAEEPSIITRLLAPLGFGALATNTPLAPVSPTTLMGFLELVRRELDRIFVNKSPAFTYDPGENIAANGAIVGTLNGADPDSTFTYTATSPAEGDVFIDSDGTFIFAPNENYDPTKGASFDVTISDASSGFHVHGLSGVLNLVTFGLVGESGHTHTETVTVSGEVPPPDFQRTVVVEGLTEPTDFRFLPRVDPDDPNEPDRILIAEKGGAIKVYNGSEVQTLTTLPVETHWARGVNGIEVDPDFNENGYIYVSYIRDDSDPADDNVQRLSRFTVTDPTADVLTIDPSSEKVLLQGTSRQGMTTTAARSVTSRTTSMTTISITQRATTSAAAWSTAAIRRILPTSTARSYASIRTAPCPRTTRSTTETAPTTTPSMRPVCVTRSGVGSRPTASCCSGMWARTPGKK